MAAFADGMSFRSSTIHSEASYAIGYGPRTPRGPAGSIPPHYDLLASEARLASFIGIAKGDLPEKHWFHLGRAVTSVHGVPALLSWSATLFEYLMPLLLMRSYPDTLLDESCRMAVRRQRDYAAERGVPWGISESAYDLVDHLGNYQYKAFGVPGLGMKRGLADELVVAPYATGSPPTSSPAQPRRTSAASPGKGCSASTATSMPWTTPEGTRRGRPGCRGPCGRGQRRAGLLRPPPGDDVTAIADALTGHRMVERFHADPRVKATELLLQERGPRHAAVVRPRPDEEARRRAPLAAVRRSGASGPRTPCSLMPSSFRTATTPRW